MDGMVNNVGMFSDLSDKLYGIYRKRMSATLAKVVKKSNDDFPIKRIYTFEFRMRSVDAKTYGAGSPSTRYLAARRAMLTIASDLKSYGVNACDTELRSARENVLLIEVDFSYVQTSNVDKSTLSEYIAEDRFKVCDIFRCMRHTRW
jgi:hypothetical protein